MALVHEVELQWLIRQVNDDWFRRQLVHSAATKEGHMVKRRTVINHAYRDLDQVAQQRFKGRRLGTLYGRWRPDDDRLLSALERSWGRVTGQLRRQGAMESQHGGWWSLNIDALPDDLKSFGTTAKRDKEWETNCTEDFRSYKEMVRDTLKSVAFHPADDSTATFGPNSWIWQHAILELNHLHHILESWTATEWANIYGVVYDTGNYRVTNYDSSLKHTQHYRRDGSWYTSSYRNPCFELPRPEDILERIKDGWVPTYEENDNE